MLTGKDLIRPSVPPSSARRYRHLSPCAGKACGDGHGADSPEIGVEGTLPRRDVEDAVPYGGKDLIRPSVPPSSARRSGSRDLIRRFAPPSPCAGKACGNGDGADSPELGVEGTPPRRDVEDAVPLYNTVRPKKRYNEVHAVDWFRPFRFRQETGTRRLQPQS